MFAPRFVLSVVVGFLFTSHAYSQQTLYAVTWGGSEQLLKINTATGASTVVGTLPATTFNGGLAARGNKLYLWDNNVKKIREIDPNTAAFLATIDVGDIGTTDGDITFRSDGTGFRLEGAFGPANLYSFDVIAGTSTIIKTGMIRYDGLACNSAGVLYGQPEAGGTLYTIDAATGAETAIGPTIGGGSALAFDASDNLYGTNATILYQFNTVTGAATAIGPMIGGGQITGMAFFPGIAPPVPPVVPPIPPPGGGLNEGNYPGSKGLSNGNGKEGTFGFGRQLQTLRPFLDGPHRDTLGSRRVLNVAHQQQVAATDSNGGAGAVGWTLLALSLLAPAAIVYGRRRPA